MTFEICVKTESDPYYFAMEARNAEDAAIILAQKGKFGKPLTPGQYTMKQFSEDNSDPQLLEVKKNEQTNLFLG